MSLSLPTDKLANLATSINKPTAIAVSLSVGIHGLVLAMLPLNSATRTIDPDVFKTVEVVELAPDQLDQLPAFAQPNSVALNDPLLESLLNAPLPSPDLLGTPFNLDPGLTPPSLTELPDINNDFPSQLGTGAPNYTTPFYNFPTTPLPPPPPNLWAQNLPLPPVATNPIQISPGITDLPPTRPQPSRPQPTLPPVAASPEASQSVPNNPGTAGSQPEPSAIESPAAGGSTATDTPQPEAATSDASLLLNPPQNSETTAEGSQPTADPNSPVAEDPAIAAAPTPSAEPDPLQQYREQYVFNGGTGLSQATVNIQGWLISARQTMGDAEITLKAPADLTASFPDPYCPTDADIAVGVILVDADGNPVNSASIVKSSGYAILDDVARSRINSQSFAGTGEAIAHQYRVGFQDVNGQCQNS
ncbi:MAG: hypothetical protein AAGF24_12455 [Cyanobacteria bacterium P01_H01_bin.121]